MPASKYPKVKHWIKLPIIVMFTVRSNAHATYTYTKTRGVKEN